MKNHLFSIALLLANFCVFGQEDEILPSERYALIDFYESTGGANWKDNTNWNSEKPVSTWYGVIVDTTLNPYHVKELELFDNNLVGTIDYSIEDLEELTVLSLSKNSLKGENTLKEICKLKKIEHLDLSENPLLSDEAEGYDHIPFEIGELTNLEYISLNKNHFGCEIPTSFSNLTKLEFIDLGGNQFSNENLDLTKFPLLERVYLEENWFLKTIDLRNDNNTSITDLNVDDCEQLTCIFVDDAAYCADNWPVLDCYVYFVETQAECDAIKTEIYVPDDNFEKALIKLGYDTTLDDYVSYNKICGVSDLNLNNKKIADLTGIDGFTSLETLYCMNNKLSSIAVRKNAFLHALFVQGNKLEVLDVRNGNNENFTYFDASKNPKLTCIYVDDVDWSTTNWTNIDQKSTFVKDRIECDAYED